MKNRSYWRCLCFLLFLAEPSLSLESLAFSRFKHCKKLAENLGKDQNNGNIVSSCWDIQNSRWVVVKASIGEAVMLLGNEAYIYALTKEMPHVVKHYETLKTPPWRYEVLEYCASGDLLQQMSHLKNRPEEIRELIKQISTVVQALHKKKIVHLDIKPGNIFIENQAIKIGDFGISRHLLKSKEIWGRIGTEQTMAPEVAHSLNKNFSYDPYKGDVFSVGAILAWAILGHPLYTSIESEQFQYFLKVGPALAIKDYADRMQIYLDPDMLDLAVWMLELDPQKRPSMKQVLAHPWLQTKSKTGETSLVRRPRKKNAFKSFLAHFHQKKDR